MKGKNKKQNKQVYPKSRLQTALEAVGWLIFIMVYSLGIAACIMLVDHFSPIINTWKAWSTGEKWLFSILWGLALLIYTLVMLGIAMLFTVLSAIIYSKLMKGKIWAERKTQEYLGEIIKLRAEGMPNPPPIPKPTPPSFGGAPEE